MFDTKEEAEAFANYLTCPEWMESDERKAKLAECERVDTERQTEMEKESQARTQAHEARLRECELVVAENPTDGNRTALKEAYGSRDSDFDDDMPF